MQQRFYLPNEYAEMLDRKASGANVSPIIYLQHLITQDHICSGVQTATVKATPQVPAPVAVAVEDEGIDIPGNWGGMTL